MHLLQKSYTFGDVVSIYLSDPKVWSWISGLLCWITAHEKRNSFKKITTKGKPSSGYRVLDDLRKFFRQYMVSLWNLAVAPSISCKTGVNHILISKIMYVYIRLRKKLNYNIWLKLFIVFLSSPTKKIKLSILYYWVQCQNISETLDRRSEA